MIDAFRVFSPISIPNVYVGFFSGTVPYVNDRIVRRSTPSEPIDISEILDISEIKNYEDN